MAIKKQVKQQKRNQNIKNLIFAIFKYGSILNLETKIVYCSLITI